MVTANVSKDGSEWAPHSNLSSRTFSNVSGDGANETQYWTNVIFCGGNEGYTHRTVHQIGTVGIAQGAMVASASLALKFEGFYKPITFKIYGILDSAGFGVVGTANLTTSQTLTTAFVAVNTGALWPGDVDEFGYWLPSTAALQSFDVAAIVQEIVSGGGWSENSTLTFICQPDEQSALDGDAHARFFAQEHATEPAATMEFVVSIDPVITSVSGDDIILNETQTVSIVTENRTGNVTLIRLGKDGINRDFSVLGTPTSTLTQFTWSQGSLGYGTAYTLTLNTSTGLSLTKTVQLLPATGKGFTVVADTTNLTEVSLGKGSNPAVALGAMFEFDSLTTNGDTVAINGRAEPSLAGAGTGEDTFNARYRSVFGVWSDTAFQVKFFDQTYLGQNIIQPVNGTTLLNGFLVVATGVVQPAECQTVLSLITTVNELEETPNFGFPSVNAPSIRVVDSGTTLNLYVDRDNTAEFQFLESGQPVDLFKATRIELKIGNQVFSDVDFEHFDKFKKLQGGFLEVQMGELGLPINNYKFYFILYTPTQPRGVVWGNKDAHTLSLTTA